MLKFSEEGSILSLVKQHGRENFEDCICEGREWM